MIQCRNFVLMTDDASLPTGLKVLEFQCQLYSLSRTPKKKEQTQKDPRDKITHFVKEPKKTDSRLCFALNGVLEKWEM